jgi:hypothetical protein
MLSLVLLTSLVLSQLGGPCGCEDKPQVNILAVVNGVKITKKELGSATQDGVSQLQDEVIKARNGELVRLINSLLLDAEAKRRGLTSEKLLELEVSAKVVEPTEDEVKAFYNQRKERIPGDFKDAKPQIIALIKAQREQTEAAKFAAMLRNTAIIQVLVQEVTPPANVQEMDRVFATVNGRPITSRNIEENLAPLIYRVQQHVYELRKADLDLKINDMLLEEEAKRENTTAEAILAREVRGKMSVITNQQAKAYYDENKSKFSQDFAQVKIQIVQYLMGREQRRLTDALAADLRKNAAVQIYLTPPEQPKTKRAG